MHRCTASHAFNLVVVYNGVFSKPGGVLRSGAGPVPGGLTPAVADEMAVRGVEREERM